MQCIYDIYLYIYIQYIHIFISVYTYSYRDIEHVSFFSCILYVSTLFLLKRISLLGKVRASSTPPAFLRNDVDEDVHEAGVQNLHPAGTWGEFVSG